MENVGINFLPVAEMNGKHCEISVVHRAEKDDLLLVSELLQILESTDDAFLDVKTT